MTPHDLYREAAKRGLRLEPAGDKLAVFPKGHCPPDFADTLRQHKAELLDWLMNSPCPGWQAVPPLDLPLNPLRPQLAPAHREAMIAYLLRQTSDRPGPLAAWLLLRENTYLDGPGRTWDCGLICYCAARDAACWQLRRAESEVLEFLETATEVYQHRDGGKRT